MIGACFSFHSQFYFYYIFFFDILPTRQAAVVTVYTCVCRLLFLKRSTKKNSVSFLPTLETPNCSMYILSVQMNDSCGGMSVCAYEFQMTKKEIIKINGVKIKSANIGNNSVLFVH